MSEEPSSKRQRTAEHDDSGLIKDPSSIVTWNADGLAAKAQCSEYMNEFQSLLETTQPQLVCIQEARLKCANGKRDTPLDGELKVIQPFLNIIINASYVPVWSLADKRNAGTCTLIHRDLLKNSTCIQKNSAFSVKGAIELLLKSYNLEGDDELQGMIQEHASTRTKNAVEAPFKKAPSQTSMKSFFDPGKSQKAKQANMSSFFKSTASSKTKLHHEEGRIQFFRFETMDLLNTYVPNNGMKEESYQRRRQFDGDMLHLLQVRQAVLNKVGVSRPMLWVGDLNVARTYMDGSHHVVSDNGTVLEEYWTNEAKCLGNSYNAQSASRNPDNVGMPGFTPKERERFELILNKTELVDVWRHLHPQGITKEELPYLGRHGGTLEQVPWDKAEFTWRGAVARNMSRARYQGKGQRIDYFLLSQFAIDRVKSCDIMGYGEFRRGFFCGSDHCASILVLKEQDETGSGVTANQDGKETKTLLV